VNRVKTVFQIAIPAVAALALIAPAVAQAPAKTAIADLNAAMTPGPAQAKLNDMVGTFDVTVSIWVTPKSVPVVSNASAVGSWVLDGRFVQTTLSGYVGGEPFNAISYAGYDNAGKTYQATWMDNQGTDQTWYTGNFAADGKSAVLSGTTVNPVSGKQEPLELRMTLDGTGNRVLELWGKGGGKATFKMMELRYLRSKP
jgi:hypothetical protein